MSGHGAGRPARKLMLYSHDTYGLGHLRRNLRIAAHLLDQRAGLQVVLVSGSPVASRFPLPPGVTLVTLPPVRKVGPESYQPVNPRLDIELVRRTRTAVMNDVVRRLRPDVLLVDHAPAGMHGELRGVFDTVRRHSPSTRLVLGLRDILDDPAEVVRVWGEQDIYRLLEDTYDQVLVYGSQEVFDVGAAYGMSDGLRRRLVYCGYLQPAVAPLPAGPGSEPYLLATAGGGGDGAGVLAGAIGAGRLLGIHTVAVAGPLMDERDFEALAAQATGAVELIRFHPHLPSAMAAASAVVTMGGYNALSEAVVSGRPTVVVPRHRPRLEQAIRARLFAERGLVGVAEPGPGLAERIAGTIAGRGSAPARRPLDLSGLERLSAALLSPPAAPPGHAGPAGGPHRHGDDIEAVVGHLSGTAVAGLTDLLSA